MSLQFPFSDIRDNKLQAQPLDGVEQGIHIMYLIWRGLRRSDTFGFCSGSRSVVCGWKVGIVNGRNRAVVLLEQDQYQTGSALHLHETYWYSSIDTYPQNLIYRGTLSLSYGLESPLAPAATAGARQVRCALHSC